MKPLPLRLCGLCQMWNSKPCGEGCALSLRDPTWEEVGDRAVPSPENSDPGPYIAEGDHAARLAPGEGKP